MAKQNSDKVRRMVREQAAASRKRPAAPRPAPEKAAKRPVRPRPAGPSRQAAPRPEPSGPAEKRPPSRPPRNGKTEQAARRRSVRGEQRRRRQRRRLVTLAALVLLALLGVALSVTVLFKVEDYRLEAPDKTVPADTGIYTEEEILAALDVPLESNLFGFSARAREKEMLEALPWLESLELRRSLPGTLVIRLAPARESFKIPCAGGWAIVSRGLKVLSVQAEEPEGMLLLDGIEALHPAAGQMLVLDGDPQAESVPESVPADSAAPDSVSVPPISEVPPEEGEPASATPRMDALFMISEALSEGDLLSGVTRLRITEDTTFSFVYEDRIWVELGSDSALDYKMKCARHILLDQDGTGLQKSDRGRLDISHVRGDGSIQPLFTPGEPEPAPPLEPLPAPAPPPESVPAESAPQTE